MASYRIIQHPCHLDPGTAEYEVQQRVWLFWEHVATCQTLYDADQLVFQLKAARKPPIKRKVLKTYD